MAEELLAAAGETVEETGKTCYNSACGTVRAGPTPAE